MTLEQMREELRQKIEELNGLQQKAQGDEGLTEEEEKRFDTVLGETEELRSKIETEEQRQQRMQNIQQYASSPQNDFDPRSANVPQSNQGNQPNQSGRYSPNAVCSAYAVGAVLQFRFCSAVLQFHQARYQTAFLLLPSTLRLLAPFAGGR